MTLPSWLYLLVLLLIGLGTWTIVFKDATTGENVRWFVSVVVLAGIFGWVLTMVGAGG